eukprot:499620_1
MEEQESKYDPNKISQFVEPRNSDYTDCQRNDHNVKNCPLMKRILHLLSYYHQQQQQKHHNIQMYEYLDKLHYNFPTFMEDWHQAKNNHFKENRDENDGDWIKQKMNIKCNAINSCQYATRYQRERGNEIHDRMKIEEIDYKNIILMDQLDSIHTFIFHTAQRRDIHRTTKNVENIESKYDDESDDDEDELKVNPFTSNHPPTLCQYNVEHILWIINNQLFDQLNEKQKSILKPHKMNIIKYIKEHNCDGNMLKEMGRKPFMNNISAYVQNKKIKASLGALYKFIMTRDIPVDEEEEKKK